jgi:DNA-binding LacI/PurR family transcriptional regulator
VERELRQSSTSGAERARADAAPPNRGAFLGRCSVGELTQFNKWTKQARAFGLYAYRSRRTTVSYVLNSPGDRPINEDTRRRVMAAVRELGYAPHSTARTLRSGRSNIVLVPMPQLPLAPTRQRFLEELGRELADRELSRLIHGDRTATGLAGARAWAELRPAAVFTEADRCPPQAAELLRQAGVDAVLLHGPQPQPHAPTIVMNSAG